MFLLILLALSFGFFSVTALVAALIPFIDWDNFYKRLLFYPIVWFFIYCILKGIGIE